MTSSKKRLEQAFSAIKINRIILPIAIGVAVVSLLLWKQFDIEAFKNIDWDKKAFLLIALGIFFYVIRHLAYAFRLKILSEGKFNWEKSVELIFIWEFASAVSPTNLGGSAVALVLLSQERIKAAKTVTIVLYSMVLDTLFFIISLPLLYLFLGPILIRPGMERFMDIDGYGVTFLLVFMGMLTYGSLFFYGLFIQPIHIQRFLRFLSSRKILRRYRASLARTADGVVSSSKDLKSQPWTYHLKAVIATFTAWFFKFALMICLIYAIIKGLDFTLHNSALIYGRYEAMFAITMFSPTPGGSGVAEFLFGGFYSDFVPISLAVIIAFLWRLIAYYSYLFMGVIIVPNWIRKVLKKRKIRRAERSSS